MTERDHKLVREILTVRPEDEGEPADLLRRVLDQNFAKLAGSSLADTPPTLAEDYPDYPKNVNIVNLRKNAAPLLGITGESWKDEEPLLVHKDLVASAEAFLKRTLCPGTEESRYVFQPVRRAVVMIDISDFSQRSLDLQVCLICELQGLVEKALNAVRERGEQLGWIPSAGVIEEDKFFTGDGCFVVFEKCEVAVTFAAAILWEIDFRNRCKRNHSESGMIHCRIGVDFGEAYFVRDSQENWNYIGDVVNNAKRALECMGKLDDAVYMTDAACRNVNVPWQGGDLIPVGRRADKHGEQHRLIMLNTQGITEHLYHGAHAHELSEDCVRELQAVNKRLQKEEIDGTRAQSEVARIIERRTSNCGSPCVSVAQQHFMSILQIASENAEFIDLCWDSRGGYVRTNKGVYTNKKNE